MTPSLIGYRVHISIIVSLLGGLGIFEKLGTNVADVNSIVEQVLKFADLGIAVGFSLYGLWRNHKNHSEMENAGIR